MQDTDELRASVQWLDCIEVLQAEMKQNYISRNALAQKLKISENKLNSWLDAEEMFDAKTLFLLARGIGCKFVCELVQLKEEEMILR